ncbi:hypothetical protein GW915_08550 [bacterium]|nr:hypothetical protein [bacterium]
MSKIIFSLLLLSSIASQAKTFKSQFIRLELPPNWDCKQEERDWVCQPDNLAERNEVIMIIVVKEVDQNDDNFDKYENILSTKKDMRDLLGNSYKSDVKYTKRSEIQGQYWVDSLHFGSEIPGFYTRYIASIDKKVAGLVTYSIAETVYPKWAEVLDRVVNSLKLEFDPKAFAEIKESGGSSLLGQRSSAKRLPPSLEEIQDKEGKKDSGLGEIIGGLLIIGAIGFFLYRKKQQQKG